MLTLPHHSPRDLPFSDGHTALLLVDMQRAWLDPQFDPHLRGPEAEYFLTRAQTTVIPNQVKLLKAVRGARQNVLHTIIESLTADGRDRSLDHKLSDMHLPRGSFQAGIIDELAVIENEIVLPKTSSGVFNSTNIDYVLRNLETRHLIIAGIVTDQCVDMAVRDAAGLLWVFGKQRRRQGRRRQAGRARGRGPPLAQSSSSTIWTTGRSVPAPICIMQPILPAAITWGAFASSVWTLRRLRSALISGCRRL